MSLFWIVFAIVMYPVAFMAGGFFADEGEVRHVVAALALGAIVAAILSFAAVGMWSLR